MDLTLLSLSIKVFEFEFSLSVCLSVCLCLSVCVPTPGVQQYCNHVLLFLMTASQGYFPCDFGLCQNGPTGHGVRSLSVPLTFRFSDLTVF